MHQLIRTIVIAVMLSTPMFAKADFIASNDVEVQSIANPVLDGILAGIKNNDYALFSKDFGIRMRNHATEDRMNEYYEGMLGNYGSYQSREYMGYVNQSAHTLVMWKAKFSKTKDDILLLVYMSKIEEANVVIGFYYQRDMWPRK